MSRLSNNLVYRLIDWAFGLVIAIVDRPKKPKTVSDILDAKARAEAKTRVVNRE